MSVVNKFLVHGNNYFTIQDLMDDIGHEIQTQRDLSNKGEPVENEILLLRMLKSDLRNIVNRYQKLEELL